MTYSHICCESCAQDIASGYAEDLLCLGMCCCHGNADDWENR